MRRFQTAAALLGLLVFLLSAFGGSTAAAGAFKPAAVTPVATLGASPSPVLAGDQIWLDATGSTDASGEIRDYKWDLGSGSFTLDSGLVPTVTTALAAGSHTVRVQVTNDAGRKDVASATVDVRPMPPEGPVAVTIDKGAFVTNDAAVRLKIVWPLYASSMTLANNSNFGSGATTLGLKPAADWNLSSGDGTRTVYARFPGSSDPTRTYTASITLDTGAPTVQKATYTRRKGASAEVLVKATENVSGITVLQFSTSRSGGTTVVIAPESGGVAQLARVIQVEMLARPAWVRARSAAGNWSKWHVVR